MTKESFFLLNAELAASAFASYMALMNGLIYVALGGALGASLRHMLGQFTLKIWGTNFPYGTFLANIFGGLFMGMLIGWLAFKVSGGENLRLFLGVGLLGGFTTFSAFSLDAYLMLERKSYGLFAGYVGGSVILSLVALTLGLMATRKLLGA